MSMNHKSLVHFFTFCVDIRRHSRQVLLRSLHELIISLRTHLNGRFKLVVYSNFINYPLLTHNDGVEIRPYVISKNMEHQKQAMNASDNGWYFLSFDKINKYKCLYDEQKIDYTWIDLDTRIVYDISYINNMKNCFIENGGNTTKPCKIFKEASTISINRNRYIQGDFWKLDIGLYMKFMKLLDDVKNKKLTLIYDAQSLFQYYIMKHGYNDTNVIGFTCMDNTVNGLSVWDENHDTHATHNGLSNMYYTEQGILRTKFHPNKDIHILSFTFYTLKHIWDTPLYKQLFYPNHS